MRSYLFLLCLLVQTIVSAQTYKPVDEGSSVKFTIKNFGFGVSGSLGGLQGVIKFNPNDLTSSSFDVTIDVKSINTGIDSRDEHLRGEDYFDSKKYPKIHFVSSRIASTNKSGTFIIYGKLTIKATSKDISFPFTAIAQNEGYVFNGSFKIKRKDFEIGGSGPISNELTVNLSVFAKK